MIECLVNGEISTYVPADDRGLYYGDGVFETLAVEQGLPRWWQDHMDRLAAGCDRLGLVMPAQAVLLREVQTASAGQSRCVAKIMLTRGSGGRGYAALDEPTALRIVSTHRWPAGIEAAARNGIDTVICKLRLASQPALGGLKHLNRLEQVLAAAECTAAGCEEGILLDQGEHVISGISANIFLASGQRLLTPRMDSCGVRGVLRARILKAFKSRCELRRISLDMLEEAEEVFMCNAIRGIVPVCRIGQRPVPPGPVTRELQHWLQEVLAG
jgi:4-amino-4-deoxychorismate lyase